MRTHAASNASLFHPVNAGFLAEVGRATGGLAEIARASDDPDKAVADHFKVTPAELEGWVLAAGRQRCAAIGNRGKRCERIVMQPAHLDPRAWVAAAAAYCRRMHEPATSNQVPADM